MLESKELSPAGDHEGRRAEIVGANAPRLVLVTGAAGKVGQAFISRVLRDPLFRGTKVRALCHNRVLPPAEGLEVVRGSIADHETVLHATQGVSHVLHLATPKETPESIMDVAVKGMFWLLEACRVSPTFKQFLLVGGDASLGHFHYPHPVPVTEEQKHSAYPGCYALSKVLEEVMLEQYRVQYGLAGTCLRAPWIMEKDDFKCQLSFGEDVFGAPLWGTLVGPELAKKYQETGAVPLALDANGRPLKRNFVHVDDLVSAILLALDHARAQTETFNICMDEPVDYGEVAQYLRESRGIVGVPIKTEFFSTWLDNSKAKFLLGFRPAYDLKRLIDAAWNHQRPQNDARVIWYPG